MQDHKKAAAGDLEETSLQNESSRNEIEERDSYILNVIEYLETFTGKHLSDQEALLWKDRLSKYPKWKIRNLSDYTGGLTNEVFKFLDAIQLPPETYRPPQIEDHSESKQNELKCGAELFKGLKIVLSDPGITDKKKAISELHKKLKKKYPQFKASIQL
jgi:hypothetical protein